MCGCVPLSSEVSMSEIAGAPIPKTEAPLPTGPSQEQIARAAQEAAEKALQIARQREADEARAAAEAAARAEADARKTETQRRADELLARQEAAAQRADEAAARMEAQLQRDQEARLFRRVQSLGLRQGIDRPTFLRLAAGLDVDLEAPDAAAKLDSWREANAWAFTTPGAPAGPSVEDLVAQQQAAGKLKTASGKDLSGDYARILRANLDAAVKRGAL